MKLHLPDLAYEGEELGLSLIGIGNNFTENPGAKHLAEILQKRSEAVEVVYLDPGIPWKVM
jgi:hypothetical protein